jgi:hypothetical protein
VPPINNEVMASILEDAAIIVLRGWTRGAWARDKDGALMRCNHSEATCWCLSGAVELAARRATPLGVDPYSYINPVSGRLARGLAARTAKSAVEFNDHIATSADEVAGLLRELAKEIRADATDI